MYAVVSIFSPSTICFAKILAVMSIEHDSIPCTHHIYVCFISFRSFPPKIRFSQIFSVSFSVLRKISAFASTSSNLRTISRVNLRSDTTAERKNARKIHNLHSEQRATNRHQQLKTHNGANI